MRVVIFLLINFLCLSKVVTAQVHNRGASITVVKGGFLFSSGSIINDSGKIISDGKIETRSSFLNNTSYTSALNSDSLLLTGSGTATLKSGLAAFNFLQVNKVSGGGVTLSSSATIGSRFDLIAGSFSTNPTSVYELIAPTSALFTFGSGTEVTGKIRRTNWITDSSVVFHQPNMVVRTTGGSAPTSLLVNMIPTGDPSLAEKEVKRYFYFSPVAGSNYMADVTFPYKLDELNVNVESSLAPWYYTSVMSKWAPKVTGNFNTINANNRYIRSIGIPATIFSNREWKLAEVEYNNQSQSLFVYPVPARNNITIVLISEQSNKASIKLYDAAGKLCRVIQKDILRGLNTFNFNIAGLSAGQYTLRIEEVNKVQAKPILVM